jgi:hypothetical protein
VSDDVAGAGHDLFISHASEDKDSFVRPLAALLAEFGLTVWFDEFTLQLGDSLAESIDRGLASSRFGLVVVSQNFLKKPWPRRELSGLVAREVGRSRIILPVWLDVSRDDVLGYSPTLADALALDASKLSLRDVALKIVERVRPELHTGWQRRFALEDWIVRNEPVVEEISIGRVNRNGPIRNESFSVEFFRRLRLMREALLEVFPVSWEVTVDNFRKDLRPEQELSVWEQIAGIYLALLNEYRIPSDQRPEAYELVFDYLGLGREWPASNDRNRAWFSRARDLCIRSEALDGSFASRNA